MIHVNIFTGSRRQACSKDITLESVLAKIGQWDWTTIRWFLKWLPVAALVAYALLEGYRILSVAQGEYVARIPLLDWPLNLVFGK